jgi:hypothetical protein
VRSKIAVLLGLVLLSFLAGCALKQQQHKLPASWPIKQLTLPADAVLTRDVLELCILGKEWMAYIDYGRSKQELVDHIEGCLKTLNYSELYGINPRLGDSRAMWRTYYSPDQLTEVSLHEGSNAGTTYGFASDYVLTITILTEPHAMLKYANTTSSRGVQNVLEPIQ